MFCFAPCFVRLLFEDSVYFFGDINDGWIRYVVRTSDTVTTVRCCQWYVQPLHPAVSRGNESYCWHPVPQRLGHYCVSMNVSVLLCNYLKFKHNASYFQTTSCHYSSVISWLVENSWMLQIYHSSWSDTHLSDVDDIFSCSRYFIGKANGILVKFGSRDSLILTKLLTSFCMSLYGCALWSHDSCAVKHLDVCMNNCLRHIWPRNGPTSILHSVSGCSSVL